jgi:hypothetical protein
VETTTEDALTFASSIHPWATPVHVQITSSWKRTTRLVSRTVLEVNTDVLEATIDVSQFIGLVTVKRIVLMGLTRKDVLLSLAKQECFSARTIRLAFREFEFVMEYQTVLIVLTKHIVTVLVGNMLSSVNQQEDVYLTPGNVMEMMTVPMVQMKIQKIVM